MPAFLAALQGGLPLVLARAVFVAGLLSLCGSFVFRVVVAPKVFARLSAAQGARVERALFRLAWASFGVAAIGIAIWTFLQTAAIAGVSGFGPTFAVLSEVLEFTQFGHLVLWQAGLLLATAGVIVAAQLSVRFAMTAGLVVSAANVAMQAAHGHAMAMDGWFSPLFGVDVLHLCAAASWVGGLLPLMLVVRLAPCGAAAVAARWFSPMGKWCVGVLAGTALIQGWVLVGSFTALLNASYGTVVLIKTALFVMLLGFAVLNRYGLAPALLQAEPELARRRLVGSIMVQTTVGVLAVLAAAVLSGLAPTMKM